MNYFQSLCKSRGFHLILTAFFLFPTLCLPSNAPLVSTVVATSTLEQEIDDLKEQSSDIKAQQQDLEAQLATVANDKSNAVARKNIIEQEIQLLQEEIENTEAQILTLDGMIYLKIEEIQQAEEDERKQYELFCQRVRAMEESGTISYWSILFAADDFSDLLDRIIMVDEIMEYDNAVMENLVAIREFIIAEREALEELRVEQEEIYLEQQLARDAKKAQEAQVDALIAQILAQEAELESIKRELESAAASMDSAIKKKEAELAAQIAALLAAQGGTVSATGFMWPLPAYNTLSSLFGGRVNPITGSSESHTGIDVPAPSGTPILCAKAGVVIISEYHYSYGNYVVVSHGGGQTTLYAHMVSRGVAEGTVLNQGDAVGYVGTTGHSTGNHLHFEIRFDGTRYDPVNYFPDKVLYIRSNGITQVLNH